MTSATLSSVTTKAPPKEKERPVRQTFLPFSRPCLPPQVHQSVSDCLTSGWLSTGPRAELFKKAMASYLGIEESCVFLHKSGTSSLFLALQILNMAPGDEVITTPLTFVATANTIALAGAKPVFVDVDPDTLNMRPDLVEAAITPRTRAIVPVHFAGLPVDLDPLRALASKHNLCLIEDAAHAAGARYKGHKIGSRGHMQVFSFHPNKNMTTGEGGALVCHLPEHHKRLQALSFHGIDRDVYNRFTKDGSPTYDVIEPSLKHNMSDLQAAIGIHQLEQLDAMNQRRQHLVDLYYSALASLPALRITKIPEYEHRHAHHLMTVRVTKVSPWNRGTFMQKLKDRNIGVGLHYEAVHLFSYYRNALGYKKGDFPVAEEIGETIMSLPLFPDMTTEDVDDVVAAVYSVVNE